MTHEAETERVRRIQDKTAPRYDRQISFFERILFAGGREWGVLEGIVIVSGWQNAVAHRAFGQGLGTHVQAGGLAKPDRVERLRIEKLGWD